MPKNGKQMRKIMSTDAFENSFNDIYPLKSYFEKITDLDGLVKRFGRIIN